MDTTLLIGILGAALLLVAFALDELDILADHSPGFNLLNLLGAGLLAWYAVLLDSWPFILLEGIWALIALRYLVKAVSQK